mmetsp:Transcript_15585/g.19310  ORF Transcript_15585/g.19310 Transcript_15585/m.19310 type:complete len:187 (+) Transcript_15585:659-1219(+)
MAPGKLYTKNILLNTTDIIMIYSEKYDEVLLLTGHETTKFPFLPPPLNNEYAAADQMSTESHDSLDRYLGMFHPQLANVVFIGFTKGVLEPLVSSYEMQARWFALLVSKKRFLPDMRTMKREISKARLSDASGRGGFTPTSWQYTNYIAEKFVRCAPNPFKLFFINPVIWFKIFTGSPTSHSKSIA